MSPDHPPRQRRQIGLSALLAGVALLAIWLGWSRSVADLLDATEQHRREVKAAKARDFASAHPHINLDKASRP